MAAGTRLPAVPAVEGLWAAEATTAIWVVRTVAATTARGVREEVRPMPVVVNEGMGPERASKVVALLGTAGWLEAARRAVRGGCYYRHHPCAG